MWFKKSDVEIQAEVKKLLGLKVLLILVPVAQVNAAVFIERTHKM
jgi:hypothetical protein